jgi:hypothetical protein
MENSKLYRNENNNQNTGKVTFLVHSWFVRNLPEFVRPVYTRTTKVVGQCRAAPAA